MRLGFALLVGVAAACAAAPAWAATPPPGLVAAYSFDESSGDSAFDASGNGHTGVVAGATWTGSGRYGGALSFDGLDDSVLLGSLGSFAAQGFTLEAWVNKAGDKRDVAIVGSWTGSGPMLWVDHLAGHHQLTLSGTLSDYLDSGRTAAVGTWQHHAATWDGTTARYYVDGAEVASRESSGPGASDTWRVGAYGTTTTGFFDGLIDDVRIYERALEPAEIEADMNQPVAFANAGAPTAPAEVTVAARTKTSLDVVWTAATDDESVAGYTVYVDGTAAGTTAATTFALTGLSCSVSYELGVEAFDASGNVSARTVTRASTALCEGSLGLVAAYALDEGSGGSAADASGNGHAGTVFGATWTSGRNGGALAFDGSDDSVALGGLGEFYRDAFTLQAWVRKQGAKNDVAVVGSWDGSGPMLWVDHLTGRYRLTLGTSLGEYLDSGRTPSAGRWQHVAATYDGATARFYLDGVEVASRAVAGAVGTSDAWRIGAYGATATGFFDGLVDDVRIYDRALTPAEIETDMNQPVPPPDSEPPSAPTGLSASSGDLGEATLSWNAATDDTRVVAYEVHRSTSGGFAPSAGTRIATVAETAFTDQGLGAGTYTYVVAAVDAAGNVGAASNEASVAVAADETPPAVTLTSPGAGATLTGAATLSAVAHDDDSLAGVRFELDGVAVGAEDTTEPFELAWDTRGEVNGAHRITAVARDEAGNVTVSDPADVTIANEGVSAVGLRAAYGFDEGSGTVALDSSGQSRTATIVDAAWVDGGRFGGAVALAGLGGHVALPALGTFYKSAFTLEAWVLKQSPKRDVAVVGTWTGGQFGGAMIWIDHLSGHYRLTLGNEIANYLDSGVPAAVGRWQHVAAAYDGATARIYVDGAETARATFTGHVGDSNTWRVGAFGASPSGFLDGLVDNVRVYDRALTEGEIQLNRVSRIQPDRTPPTATQPTPSPGAVDVGVGASVSVTFDEPMEPATVTGDSFVLEDLAGVRVPATVSYDTASRVATLRVDEALRFGATYRATLRAGVPTDLPGNALADDVTWTFATEPSPPILVVTSSENRFSEYLGEILRSEGLSAFATVEARLVTPALLDEVDVVVLGSIPVGTALVSALSDWVGGGGNLIAMRPDERLAELLGLTAAGSTIANVYLKVDPATPAGNGLVESTIQFHGVADEYVLDGATAIATLHESAEAAAGSPAVTLRSIGSAGGEAAAFAFDLPRSIVYTRQGNPAWAGQERDGLHPIRPNDLFFGAKTGDVQADWLDTDKLPIPQADEQQRLLANLITLMARDRVPLPRFWYLPRGEKAVVVLSGDDHSPANSTGATAATFDALEALSPEGCDVGDWECVRSTSYLYPENPLTDEQAASYVADGFEIALHPVVTCLTGAVPSPSEVEEAFASQLSAFAARFSSVPPPATSRTHCVVWPDWATVPKVEAAHGIRLDANYYHYPGSWIGDKPGFMNGGGFPMRFADLDGSVIDVYQQNTAVTDESGQEIGATIEALLDGALGPNGYYGAFGANMHTDENALHAGAEAIVRAAQMRDVPVISYEQLLRWVDGRDASRIHVLDGDGATVTFATTVGAGANGLQAMLPVEGPNGTLGEITRDGAPVPYTVRTVKGIRYAMFDAATATFEATYS